MLPNYVFSIYRCKCNCVTQDLLLTFKRYLPSRLSNVAKLSSFQFKTLNFKTFNLKSSLNLSYSARKCLQKRFSTIQGSFISKNDEKNVESNFQELTTFRKQQALRSILLHIPAKGDIPYALAKCEQLGTVTNAFSYTGEKNDYFVLVEFSDETATQEFFKTCQYQQAHESFPVFSRIIQFEEKLKKSIPKLKVKLQEGVKTELFLGVKSSVSEVIKNIYLNERLTELDIRLRYFLCILVQELTSGIFSHCNIIPFGSSVNGVGRRGCDLDITIKLYPDNDHRAFFHEENADGELTFFTKTCIGEKSKQQKVVNFLGNCFNSFLPGATSVEKILYARVPIMKVKHESLKVECDVSVNNMSAVLMSDIVYFFGEVDARFRPVLFAVKKWAKEASITHNTPGNWITNFGLTNLLIFYFQKEELLPALSDAVVIVREDNSPNFHLQYLKSIEEWKNHTLQNEKSIAEILLDFLTFLAEYKFDKYILSLMSGKGSPHSQEAIPLWVPYPFNEDLNVTKNVSEYEFSELCHKAGMAAKCLEKQLLCKFSYNEFSTILGLSKIVEKPKKRNGCQSKL